MINKIMYLIKHRDMNCHESISNDFISSLNNEFSSRVFYSFCIVNLHPALSDIWPNLTKIDPKPESCQTSFPIMGRGLHFTPALSRHGSLLLSLLSSELTTNLQTPLESGNQVRACFYYDDIACNFFLVQPGWNEKLFSWFQEYQNNTHGYQKCWF